MFGCARLREWVRDMQIARVGKRSTETQATFSHGGVRRKCTLPRVFRDGHTSRYFRLATGLLRTDSNWPRLLLRVVRVILFGYLACVICTKTLTYLNSRGSLLIEFMFSFRRSRSTGMILHMLITQKTRKRLGTPSPKNS